MKFITKDFGNLDYAYIIPIADLHIGEELFAEKKFIKLRDWILNTDNAYAVLVGDLLNCATKNSKSDIYGERMNPGEAIKHADKLLSPIKHRILGSCWGNHERRVYRESGVDISEVLADKLGIPYGREGVLYNIKFDRYPQLRQGKINYTIYTNHGTGGGRTKSSKVAAVARLSDLVLADCYVSAHTHLGNGNKDTYIIPDTRNGKLDFITMTYVSAGSYLEWGGYAEDGSFPPGKIGTSRIRCDGRRKDLHVSI